MATVLHGALRFPHEEMPLRSAFQAVVGSAPCCVLLAFAPPARGAPVDVVTCSMTYGAPENREPAHVRRMETELPRDVASSLSWYDGDLYGVLAPKGWCCEAAIGVDLSGSLAVHPCAKGTPESVALYDSGGGCVGCALRQACHYFPWARQEAAPFGGCEQNPGTERVTWLDAVTVQVEDGPMTRGLLSGSGRGLPSTGLMTFRGPPGDHPAARILSCTLRDNRRRLCEPIVRDFLRRAGSQRP